MDEVLRANKELRIINCGNITNRLLKASNGDMFVAYNTLRDSYEIHSVYSFKHNGISLNTPISEDKLNQELIEIIKSCNIKRFGRDIRENRDYLNKILDNREEDGFNKLLIQGRKMIQTVLGREI